MGNFDVDDLENAWANRRVVVGPVFGGKRFAYGANAPTFQNRDVAKVMFWKFPVPDPTSRMKIPFARSIPFVER
jgi:hypothetical protein